VIGDFSNIEEIKTKETSMLSVIMSGLNVAQKELSVVANNLANASTVGFKRSDASFLDVFSTNPSANPKILVGSGAITGEVSRDTGQGSLTSTGKVTDLAIAGAGYFVTKSGDTETYTRAGNFNVDKDGNICSSDGAILQSYKPKDDKGAPDDAATAMQDTKIELTKDNNGTKVTLSSVAIDQKGLISASYSDSSTSYIGYIGLATFGKEQALSSLGGAKYAATIESGDPTLSKSGAPSGTIMSGTLEEANVDVTKELMTMIRSQQVYSGNARMLQTDVELTQRMTDKL
jgi:flagellar hook protein FlgE